MSTTVLDVPALETLIAASVAAPSIHNTQPWRFRLDPDTVTLEIRAVAERGLRNAACGTPIRPAAPCTSRSAARCSTCGSRSPTAACGP
ncbi:hypothetical protein OK074_1510 [Actinobacteria bacterium OK074]|nr:hypothetical protein OK074_1510 [Actinobacteria bacterium OK074]